MGEGVRAPPTVIERAPHPAAHGRRRPAASRRRRPRGSRSRQPGQSLYRGRAPARGRARRPPRTGHVVRGGPAHLGGPPPTALLLAVRLGAPHCLAHQPPPRRGLDVPALPLRRPRAAPLRPGAARRPVHRELEQDYLTLPAPPANRKAVVEMVPFLKALPKSPRVADAYAVHNDVYADVFNGRITPREACQKIDEQVNPILSAR
jgi:hypothetical protein